MTTHLVSQLLNVHIFFSVLNSRKVIKIEGKTIFFGIFSVCFDSVRKNKANVYKRKEY